jgi:N-acetylglucosaminyl-diphospho-decaprenol L-rhamnosyltransferase
MMLGRVSEHSEDAPCGVSVIVVNYNSGPMLVSCLRALTAATGSIRTETIVVDNGSTDESVRAALESEFRPNRIIELGRNLGFARANNVGARTAQGSYFLLLNTDCFLCPGALEVLVRRLESEPRTAVVGPRLLNSDGSLQRSTHNFPSPLTFFLEQSNLWRLLASWPQAGERVLIAGDHSRPRSVDWLLGACFLVRRDAFTQVGGFDPGFFFYWEEADLCMRLREETWKVAFEPGAEAVHLGGASSSSLQLRIHFFRSLYRFYRKHFRPDQLVLTRAMARILALLKAAQMAITAMARRGGRLDPAHLRAEVRSWLAVTRL